MQELNQPQINLLRDILVYAKSRVPHPQSGHNGLPPYRKASDYRKAADEFATRIEAYDLFHERTDEALAFLKSFDFPTSLDADITTDALKSAVLGDLLADPDKFVHLGKRGPVSVPMEDPS